MKADPANFALPTTAGLFLVLSLGSTQPCALAASALTGPYTKHNKGGMDGGGRVIKSLTEEQEAQWHGGNRRSQKSSLQVHNGAAANAFNKEAVAMKLAEMARMGVAFLVPLMSLAVVVGVTYILLKAEYSEVQEQQKSQSEPSTDGISPPPRAGSSVPLLNGTAPGSAYASSLSSNETSAKQPNPRMFLTSTATPTGKASSVSSNSTLTSALAEPGPAPANGSLSSNRVPAPQGHSTLLTPTATPIGNASSVTNWTLTSAPTTPTATPTKWLPPSSNNTGGTISWSFVTTTAPGAANASLLSAGVGDAFDSAANETRPPASVEQISTTTTGQVVLPTPVQKATARARDNSTTTAVPAEVADNGGASNASQSDE
ncbi:hypothetical protein CSUI_011316 [Cystoisospora suis]|uniref:Transmembrane protein n=1 Tax=Cystoisospora suis TaxID=483139 RepID=A0A2C6KEP3_9APIC|nr:hypothetical protein CSUI_011316 [Cystoisospora suis]